MSIIITEEDLCKKHAKKCAKICQFSSLPSKCFQAVNDPNTKIDSKPHICAYNYNTRTGFRAHKKIWGPRVLSSTLLVGAFSVIVQLHRLIVYSTSSSVYKTQSALRPINMMATIKVSRLSWSGSGQCCQSGGCSRTPLQKYFTVC